MSRFREGSSLVQYIKTLGAIALLHVHIHQEETDHTARRTLSRWGRLSSDEWVLSPFPVVL